MLSSGVAVSKWLNIYAVEPEKTDNFWRYRDEEGRGAY